MVDQFCSRCGRLHIACECKGELGEVKDGVVTDPAIERGLWEEKVNDLQEKLAEKNIECERWREAYEKARGELAEPDLAALLGVDLGCDEPEQVEAQGDKVENKILKLELEIKRLKRERDQAQRWWDRMLGIAKLSWRESDELKKLVSELSSSKGAPVGDLYRAMAEVRAWAVNAESTRLACSKIIEIADAAMAKARELWFRPEESKYED